MKFKINIVDYKYELIDRYESEIECLKYLNVDDSFYDEKVYKIVSKHGTSNNRIIFSFMDINNYRKLKELSSKHIRRNV